MQYFACSYYLGWALFIFLKGCHFGHALPQQEKNETISLSVKLPVPESSKEHLQGVLWQDLSVLTPSNQYLLHPSSGFLANGKVCGVLGPSGAGKTTFLSTIAGRPESTLRCHGHVLHYLVQEHHTEDKVAALGVHCAPILPSSVAWLYQHDAFFERLTVQETLDLAVFLQLPHLSPREQKQVAQSCLDSLGLSSLHARYVGSSKAPRVSDGASLSGGELRRLSVAIELVATPNLFLADEPTSGIDSKMSENVMAAIAALARERHIPCFCTLHQPRSSIWHMLDSVILMAPGGRVCYAGSREDAVPYFAFLGYTCPSETNPAEFLIDLVSINTEDEAQAEIDLQRIQRLAASFQQYTRKQKESQENAEKVCSVSKAIHAVNRKCSPGCPRPCRIIRRFGALVRRSWRQNIRYSFLNVFRLGTSAGTAVFLSQIFDSVGKGEPKPKSVVDRVALLSFGVINMMMATVMKTLNIFANEKPVIVRERHRKLYTCLEYLLSKAAAEFPLDAAFAAFFTTALKQTTGLAISWKDLTATFSLMTICGASLGYFIGSITPSQEASMAAGIPIIIVMMIVGIINPSGVDLTVKKPVLIQAIKRTSPIAAAIEALSVAEFSGMRFEEDKSLFGWRRIRDWSIVGGVALVKNGDEVLHELGLTGVKYKTVMRHMALLSIVNFGLCWFFLQFQSSQKRWWKKLARFFKGFVCKETTTDNLAKDLGFEDAVMGRREGPSQTSKHKPVKTRL